MLLKIFFIFLFFVSFSWSLSANRAGYVSMETFDKVVTGNLVQLYSDIDISLPDNQKLLYIVPAFFSFSGPTEFSEQYRGVNFQYSLFNKNISVRYGVIINIGEGESFNSYDFEYKNFNAGFFLEKIQSKTERSFLVLLATKKDSSQLSNLKYVQKMYYGKYINIKDNNIYNNILFQRSWGVELLSFFGFDKASPERTNLMEELPRFGDIGFFYSPTFVFLLEQNEYFKLGAEFGFYLNGTKHFTIDRPDIAYTVPDLMQRVRDYSQFSANLFFVFHTGNLDFYITKYKQGEFDNSSILVNYKLYSF